MSVTDTAGPSLLTRDVDATLERVAAARAEIGASSSARSGSSI